MKKTMYIILSIFLLQCFLVSGVSFSIDVTPVKNKITLEGAAEYQLTITNNEETDESFQLKVPDFPQWFLYLIPDVNPKVIEVKAESSKTVNFLLDPNPNLIGRQGSYFVNFEVISLSDNEKLVEKPTVGIDDDRELPNKYVATVTIEPDIPEKINPSKEFKFRVLLKNRNKLDIKNAKLIVNSQHINEEKILDISPFSEENEVSEIVNFNVKLDPKTAPIQDKMTIDLQYEGKSVHKIVENFEIIRYSDINEEKNEVKGFLQKTNNVIFTNLGNVVYEGDVRIPTTFMKRFFTSTKPDANLINDDGNYYYTWNVNLAPYDEFEAKVKVNYLWVALIIIALILGSVILFIKRPPLVVKKEITETHTDAEGISKLKVLLTVKNRSTMKVKEISVIDKIPKLLQIEKTTSLGSLKPDKILKNKNNETLIMWKIDELQPSEERVITYDLNSDLKILGGLTLQPAMITLRANGKETKIKSNLARV